MDFTDNNSKNINEDYITEKYNDASFVQIEFHEKDSNFSSNLVIEKAKDVNTLDNIYITSKYINKDISIIQNHQSFISRDGHNFPQDEYLFDPETERDCSFINNDLFPLCFIIKL